MAISSRREVDDGEPRSEEHTSELQSQSNLVCRLLLEKKKTSMTHGEVEQRVERAPRYVHRPVRIFDRLDPRRHRLQLELLLIARLHLLPHDLRRNPGV